MSGILILRRFFWAILCAVVLATSGRAELLVTLPEAASPTTVDVTGPYARLILNVHNTGSSDILSPSVLL